MKEPFFSCQAGILIVIGALLFWSSLGYAQYSDEEVILPDFSIGITIGGAVPLADIDFDDKFQGLPADVSLDSIDIKEGVASSLTFRYSILEWLSVGLNLDHVTFRVSQIEVDVDNLTYKESLGRVYSLTFAGILEFRVPPNLSYMRMSPYLYIGGGFNYHIWDDPEDSNTEMDIDDTFGFLVGIGVEFIMTPGGSLFLEASYHYDKADFDLKEDGIAANRYSGEFDLSDMRFVIGMRFYF